MSKGERESSIARRRSHEAGRNAWPVLATLLVLSVTAPHARGRAEASLLEDPRLRHKVSASPRAEWLPDVLAQLTNAAGPQLHVPGEAGWMRVTLFARERPVQQILSALGELCDYQWKAKPPESVDPNAYVLIQTTRARRHEEALWNASLDRAVTPILRLARLTGTPAEEWRHRLDRGEDAGPTGTAIGRTELALLAHPGTHAGLRLLTTLSVQHRRALVEHQYLHLPWATLTSEQRALAQTVANHPPRFDNNERFLSEQAYGLKVTRNQSWLREFGLLLVAGVSPTSGQLTTYAVSMAHGQVSCGAVPDSLAEQPLLRVRGRPYGKPAEPPDAYAALAKIPFPPGRKLTAGSEEDWSEVLARLAQDVTFPIYSDDFTGTRNVAIAPPKSLKSLDRVALPDGLDKLCEGHGRLWWWEGGSLYFRSRTWFIERQYEVPLPVLALLAREIRKSDRLNDSALVALGQLTLQQLQGLSAVTAFDLARSGVRGHERGRAYGHARRAYPILQFCKSLTPPQRQRVLAEQGLRREDLSRQQLDSFLAVVILSTGSGVLDEKTVPRIRIAQGRALPPKQPGQPWILPLMLSCADNGTGIPLLVPYSPRSGSDTPP